MTAQVCESIIYKGKKLEMATEPLKVILDNRPELEFYGEWTSCWRGYHGTWEIADERLYLVDLERDTSIIEDRQCIGEVFPNQNPPIFRRMVHWRDTSSHGRGTTLCAHGVQLDI